MLSSSSLPHANHFNNISVNFKKILARAHSAATSKHGLIRVWPKLIAFGHKQRGDGDVKAACKQSNPSTKNATIRKHVGLWAAGIGALASVGLLAAAPVFAGANDGAPRCTLATLKGRYLFAAPAVIFPPALGLTEQAIGNAAGFHVFNGNGTGHDYVTFTLNGVDQHVPSPNDLTYTLNPDCTGTYAIVGGGPTFDIFVSPNGDEMTAINTEGSAASYTPSRRVWPK